MTTAMPSSLPSTLAGVRLLHAMLRVGDLERSLRFYTQMLGMRLLRREDYPEGRFTLAFIGYGEEADSTVLELTHNWETDHYEIGTAYGHVALEVTDVLAACEHLRAEGVKILREPGPMRSRPVDGSAPDVIAFLADPDGYRIELIERRSR